MRAKESCGKRCGIWGARKASAAAALDPRPTNAFEMWAVAELKGLREDVEEIKKRVDWLTVAILGAALTFVLETIFR